MINTKDVGEVFFFLKLVLAETNIQTSLLVSIVTSECWNKYLLSLTCTYGTIFSYLLHYENPSCIFLQIKIFFERINWNLTDITDMLLD